MRPTGGMSQLSTAPPRAVPTPRRRGYRPELQGLRALAVLLVVVYHVWFGRVSGGVDVFFVISGFLITGQLVRASNRGRIDFRLTWARMIKRLFPAALTVLVATIAASILLLPQDRWFQTIGEVFASALYLENWRLAVDSVDYFAQRNTASVVQHFWSLSIQGQFYVVWPLLVAAVALLARRRTGGVLFAVLLVAFAASLTYSIVLTATNQPLAYFHSLTRVWEFAIGGLLALGIETLRPHRNVRVAIGWLGVVALILCGLLLRVGREFPGYLALWPTLCAVLVILAGVSGSRFGVDRLLAARPAEYLGDLSYTLYLWHWPVLLFFLAVTDTAGAGLLGGLLVIALAMLLAVATHHLIEKPVRASAIGERSRWGVYRFGLVLLVVVLTCNGGWQLLGNSLASTATVPASAAIRGTNVDHPGAQARLPGFRYRDDPNAEPAPAYVALREDWAQLDDASCRYSERDPELQICSNRVTAPAKRIVLIGDSHAQQYIAALEPLALQRNWQIITMLKGACPFTAENDTDPRYRSCVDFNTAAAEEIRDLRPDAVFTIGSRQARVGLIEETPRGFLWQWQRMHQAGIPVLAVRDSPRYNYAPSECLQQTGDIAECSTPRQDMLAEVAPYRKLRDVPPNVHFLDFSDYFCQPRRCPPVIGNVLVYLDDNHVTATFMTTLAPILGSAIDRALGW